MARQHVMTPGFVGGQRKKQDEFTFDDLLDDMAEKNRKENESLRRDKSFSDAFRSMVATPQEYTEAQDKSYRQDQAVANFIKGIPMPSKEYPEGQDPFWGYEDEYEDKGGGGRYPPGERAPHSGPSSAAMYEYIKGGQRGPTPGMTIENYRESRQDYINLLEELEAAGKPTKHVKENIDAITESLLRLGFDG